MRKLPIVLAAAVGIGAAAVLPESWLIAEPHGAEASDEVWACPMLCVKLDKPGTCPVCGMDLERLEDTGDKVRLDNRQADMIGLETALVELRPMHRSIRTVGTLDYNQRRLKTISAWVAGRIDRLYADHTFTDVRRDDHLLLLYSPELFAAQKELLIGGITKPAARRKLELLGMHPQQIAELERTQEPRERLDILSPITGKVVELKVKEGDYVKVGTPLATVADYRSFWLRFDAYEEDLPWIAIGQPVEVTLDAWPGRVFEGTVSFIEGVVDARTRTTKVRVTVDDEGDVLKPGMLANVRVKARLGSEGRVVPPPLHGRYGCYMHPSVTSDSPGSCPHCGMKLELRPAVSPTADVAGKVLAVPASAVLSTGERHVVYVMTSARTFELRQVHVGVRAAGYRHVLHGLKAGEEVATSGALLIDSQLQLTGQASLLVPGGGAAGGGHQH